MSETFGWDPIDLASVPPLGDGEVHIFAIRLTPDAGWAEAIQRVLDPAERQRAARFRFEEDRYRFGKTRAALRLLLGNYLSEEACGLAFREGCHGKPYLQLPLTDLQFNVSHTHGAAVLAFSRGFELGIDIESARRKIDVEGVGRRVFSEHEQASLRGLGAASQLRQFYRLWTAKEAYLKATGSGLSCDPSSIEANFASGRYHAASGTKEGLPYALREIGTANRFLVCLAHADCEPPTVRARELI